MLPNSQSPKGATGRAVIRQDARYYAKVPINSAHASQNVFDRTPWMSELLRKAEQKAEGINYSAALLVDAWPRSLSWAGAALT